MKTKTKLPKWFLDGYPVLYAEGDVVQNPFSGETYELNAEELSMYDYILGLQWTIDRRGGLMNPATSFLQKQMAKGLAWFRTHNAEAYMVLLD